MTTKNNQPTRLAQILESPEADQGYPVWEEEKMWGRVHELSAPGRSSRQRRYGLWIMMLGLGWSISGTDRLADAQKKPAVEPSKTAPVARVELRSNQKLAFIDIQVIRNKSIKEPAEAPSAPSTIMNSLRNDTLADQTLPIETRISPLPQITPIILTQQVYPTTSPFQLPPKPWRKKYSTLYTLRVPETPYDWDLKEGYVRRLEQQVKSVPAPHNGWMAFQIQREAGTAFSLVYRSKDTLNILDTEIHLHTKKR